jgi:hypothetical protein
VEVYIIIFLNKFVDLLEHELFLRWECVVRRWQWTRLGSSWVFEVSPLCTLLTNVGSSRHELHTVDIKTSPHELGVYKPLHLTCIQARVNGWPLHEGYLLAREPRNDKGCPLTSHVHGQLWSISPSWTRDEGWFIVHGGPYQISPIFLWRLPLDPFLFSPPAFFELSWNETWTLVGMLWPCRQCHIGLWGTLR